MLKCENNDLCFPVIDLYRNQIEHHVSLEAVV